MKTLPEQKLAENFLAHRGGYSLAYILRRSKARYALHLACIVLFIVGLSVSDCLWIKGFCLWGIGMLLGALLRDFGWLRRIKNQWTFTQKIINWQAVEDIAKGKESETKEIGSDGLS